MKAGAALVLLIVTAGMAFISASWTNASGVPAVYETLKHVSPSGGGSGSSVLLKNSKTQTVGGLLISSGRFEFKSESSRLNSRHK